MSDDAGPSIDGRDLLHRIAAANAGDRILMSRDVEIDGPLRLDRPLILEGPDGEWPVIWLTSPDAMLVVEQGGCEVRNLVVAPKGFHHGPLIRVSAACGVRFRNVGLVGSRGVGLIAENCTDLELHGIAAKAIGGSTLALQACHRVEIELACLNVSRNELNPAVLLAGCTEVSLKVAVVDAGDSVVTIRPGGFPELKSRVAVSAAQCGCAINVLAPPEKPASGLDLCVRLGDGVDCGVLLSNVDGATLDIMPGATPARSAVQIEGRAGARNCKITCSAQAEARDPDRGLAIEAGDLGRNRPRMDRLFEDAAPVGLPEALAAVLLKRNERPFTSYWIDGLCKVCGVRARFRRRHPSLRESLTCPSCKSSFRYRGQAEALVEVLGGGAEASLASLAGSGALSELSIYEPGTAGPLRQVLSKAKVYKQSVFEPALAAGGASQQIEHQDLMALTYRDGTFDLVVTSDVFEHIRKPFDGFREVFRVLKPGGAHVFTIPLASSRPNKTVYRVDTSGPDDIHILPPRYHDAGKGGRSLVYTDFGHDLDQQLQDIGFAPTRFFEHHQLADEVPVITVVSKRPA
jgi:SAM-dependent methyltransferase